ncbi:Unknown protein, partial [Striga hermonthica]
NSRSSLIIHMLKLPHAQTPSATSYASRACHLRAPPRHSYSSLRAVTRALTPHAASFTRARHPPTPPCACVPSALASPNPPMSRAPSASSHLRASAHAPHLPILPAPVHARPWRLIPSPHEPRTSPLPSQPRPPTAFPRTPAHPSILRPRSPRQTRMRGLFAHSCASSADAHLLPFRSLLDLPDSKATSVSTAPSAPSARRQRPNSAPNSGQPPPKAIFLTDVRATGVDERASGSEDVTQAGCAIGDQVAGMARTGSNANSTRGCTVGDEGQGVSTDAREEANGGKARDKRASTGDAEGSRGLVGIGLPSAGAHAREVSDKDGACAVAREWATCADACLGAGGLGEAGSTYAGSVRTGEDRVLAGVGLLGDGGYACGTDDTSK